MDHHRPHRSESTRQALAACSHGGGNGEGEREREGGLTDRHIYIYIHTVYIPAPSNRLFGDPNRWFLGTCCHQEAPVKSGAGRTGKSE